MATLSTTVDLAGLIELYHRNEQARETVAHNLTLLRSIRGGLRMAEQHRLAFDPRAEYWRLPERRLALAYLAERWSGRFARPRSVRDTALEIVLHLERARAAGLITHQGTLYEQPGGLAAICSVLAEHARKLPHTGDWDELRTVFPKLARSAGEDVANFLDQVPHRDSWDHGFFRRLPWFGYLGSISQEDLLGRQAFFYGFANLWTTTNAYIRGGALAFAPVLQNTRSEQLLNYALRWAKGTSPIESGFVTLGRDDSDDEAQDRAEYSSVIEVYGFLNLERAPFYNSLAETYREWFGVGESRDAYELTARVGRVTSQWLAQSPSEVRRLSELLRSVIAGPWSSRVEFESLSASGARTRAKSSDDALLDTELFAELDRFASAELSRLTEAEGAALMLHLLLDSKVYLERGGKKVMAGQLAVAPLPPKSDSPGRRADPLVYTLPLPLRMHGERALSYLKAGLHVLFAGAPGTGKTTLAQFVGHAWNSGAAVLPDEMSFDDVPLTTVGNSAWSSFHTIGGMVPAEGGRFTIHRGIFMERGEGSDGTWRLHDGAIVLDEMNRADLDRCIGELYPLLSGSVNQVWPAGLPGVQAIENSPRFRVIATVNDANLDDIVFPISDGLARRFQRIELPGASLEDIQAYLGIASVDVDINTRRAAADEAITRLMELANEDGLLFETDVAPRFPFGAAYFALLKAWIDGRLGAPAVERTAKEQARELIGASLRTLGRDRKWEGLSRKLRLDQL